VIHGYLWFGRVEILASRHEKKNKNKSRVNLEPRSAHGRAVKKSRVNLEPRSAHGRAVNKPRVDYEPRSAHGRAVKNNRNKSRVNLEPRSAHGRAVNKKLLRPYNRAITKNDDAGLERNRF